MEGGVRAGAVIEFVQRPPQIRIDFLVSGCQARRLKLDDSAKQSVRNYLDRMVCELDGGVVLVRPHRKTCNDAGNVGLPVCHFCWSNFDVALDRPPPNWSKAQLGNWQYRHLYSHGRDIGGALCGVVVVVFFSLSLVVPAAPRGR